MDGSRSEKHKNKFILFVVVYVVYTTIVYYLSTHKLFMNSGALWENLSFFLSFDNIVEIDSLEKIYLASGLLSSA